MAVPDSTNSVEFIVLGEPASKANSRQIVKFGKRPAIIKSKKARDYEANFARQCPTLPELIEGNIKVTITIWYASRRPDIDESIILDAMQKKIYKNDRQVREKHIYGDIDRTNPRSHVRVERIPD